MQCWRRELWLGGGREAVRAHVQCVSFVRKCVSASRSDAIYADSAGLADAVPPQGQCCFSPALWRLHLVGKQKAGKTRLYNQHNMSQERTGPSMSMQKLPAHVTCPSTCTVSHVVASQGRAICVGQRQARRFDIAIVLQRLILELTIVVLHEPW